MEIQRQKIFSGNLENKKFAGLQEIWAGEIVAAAGGGDGKARYRRKPALGAWVSHLGSNLLANNVDLGGGRCVKSDTADKIHITTQVLHGQQREIQPLR